jgi:hypothetical protein
MSENGKTWLVEKNRRQNILVELGTYNAKTFIYLRTVPIESGSEWNPAHPGAAFRPDVMRALIPVLEEALKAADLEEAEQQKLDEGRFNPDNYPPPSSSRKRR